VGPAVIAAALWVMVGLLVFAAEPQAFPLFIVVSLLAAPFVVRWARAQR
jgi:hypothetical protein